MGLLKRIRMVFRGAGHDFVPILTQQTDFLSKTSSLLVDMFETDDIDLRAGMEMDDCLDAIKDTSKAVLIYRPAKLDDQLKDLAQMAKSQSEVIHDVIPLLVDLKKNLPAISMACERVTELEHAADDAYEEYVGYIFINENDTRELVKYKNLAEMLENATDAHKRISDNIRKLLLNYLAD